MIRRGVATLLALVATGMTGGVWAEGVVSFTVPAMPVSACLQTIGAQAGVTVAGDARLMAGARCDAVKGGMTVAEALERALRNSHIMAVRLAPTIYRIIARPAPAPPIPVPPPPAAPSNDLVWPEIVVVARAPILWRVSKGASEIFILGSVAPMPARSDWSPVRVRRYLSGAHRLFIAPQPRAGLVWMDRWNGRDAAGLFLPRGLNLEAMLPPSLRERFVAARLLAGRQANRYSALRPAIAATLLLDDWRRKAGLVTVEPARAVEQMARRDGIAIQRIDPVADIPTLDQFPNMDDEAQLACLRHMLANIEAESDRAERQARDWAMGDVEALRSSYLPPATCSDEIPGDRDRRAKALADWTRALKTALDTPGRSFAVVDIATLLTPDGLLASLRGPGVEISVPGM